MAIIEMFRGGEGGAKANGDQTIPPSVLAREPGGASQQRMIGRRGSGEFSLSLSQRYRLCGGDFYTLYGLAGYPRTGPGSVRIGLDFREEDRGNHGKGKLTYGGT